MLAQLGDVALGGRAPTHELLGAQGDVQQTRLLQGLHGVEEVAVAGRASGAGAFGRSQGRRGGRGNQEGEED